MRFGVVPKVAEAMRPWAKTQVIGPPTGREDAIGSLVAQVDDCVTVGNSQTRGYRVYLELEDGDIQKLLKDGHIELTLIARQMVPVAVQIIPEPTA